MLIQTILADLKAPVDPTRNSGLRLWAKALLKGAVAPSVHVVIAFRLSQVLYRSVLTRPFAFLLRTFTIVWGGTEIHPDAKIGPGLCLVHSHKVVIGEGVVIGSNARICHGVSIGGDMGRHDLFACPEIGDWVQIGMDAIIMGPVKVGDHAQIGAQSLVVKDVPAHGVAAGSPARVLRIKDEAVVE
ncbi:serine O-acetyltransferase [Nocardioides sp.]|uniref:serine O-acetyltransferase n=1 Tax=Nocardioides sp. TaxID=35761 RepID=UPI002735B693|nr:hypothetical protein [Nocardioides sp.]MDP3892942.1 hypothetical protein [Nocardioides sp.]